MELGLRGRGAIVAAASSGLGKAVAEELAREGAEVAICSRNAAAIDRAASEIEKSTGRRVHAQVCDVTRYEAIKAFVDDAERRVGHIDICVTNSGGPPSKKFAETSAEEWRAAVDLLLMSTVHFAKEVLPRMQRRRWGRFITITSQAVKQPINGLVLSNSIRAAVTGLARTLANEFGADGITVNNVCPGYTATDRLMGLSQAQAKIFSTTQEKIIEGWAAEVPVKRIARADEFAACVAFLASERASYINGSSIAVDGGWIRSLL